VVVFLARAAIPGPRRLLPLASLPALALALLPAQRRWRLPALLLGVTLRVDGLARPLLLLIGLAWSAAAWFAAGTGCRGARSASSPVLAGHAGRPVVATLAGELVTFYTGYVVMTLRRLRPGGARAQRRRARAARVYLVLALFGEALLLSGAAGRLASSAMRAVVAARCAAGWRCVLAAALLLGGFAVKMAWCRCTCGCRWRTRWRRYRPAPS
jgi:formate hydrogenlyase subunit 3/multisubunit Na+/H+ antiporter MnhD subunit